MTVILSTPASTRRVAAPGRSGVPSSRKAASARTPPTFASSAATVRTASFADSTREPWANTITPRILYSLAGPRRLRRAVDIRAHVVQFLVHLLQLVVHDVPHGEERHDLRTMHHREVPAAAAAHGFHGLFDAGKLVHGSEVPAHDLGDGSSLRIATRQDNAVHEVALAEHAPKLVPVQDQDSPNVQFRHSAGDVGDCLTLLNAEELTVVYDVSHSGHSRPPET